jgi:hypothetical protein
MSIFKSTQIRDYIQTVRRIKSQGKPIAFNTNRYENYKHTKPAIFRKEVAFWGPVYLGNIDSNKNIAAALNKCSKSRKMPAKNGHKIVQNHIIGKDFNVKQQKTLFYLMQI